MLYEIPVLGVIGAQCVFFVAVGLVVGFFVLFFVFWVLFSWTKMLEWDFYVKWIEHF